MRILATQFVLALGSLLAFANSSPLLAGIIFQAEIDVIPTDVFHTDSVVREDSRPTEQGDSSAMDLACAEAPPRGPSEPAFRQDRSLALCGHHESVQEESGRSTHPNGLGDDDSPTPTSPPPPSTPGGGETGAPGIAPNIGPKDQPIHALTSFAPPTTEGEGTSSFYDDRSNAEPPAGRLFRPPRGPC